ncbi:MAG: DNA methyltransferase [Promethearchaeota archaeon]
MTDENKLAIPQEIGESKQNELHLKPDYAEKIRHKVASLQDKLDQGVEAFRNLNLTDAAKKFRGLATEIKLLQSLISTEGNYSDRNSLNDLSGKHWLQHTKSWLVVDGHPKQLDKQIKNHPASFPPDLAAHFIDYFTKQNQWVFDPFIGIGSTAEACLITKRNCFGIELNPTYARYTRHRISGDVANFSDSDSDLESNFGSSLEKFSDASGKLKFAIKTGDARETVKFWRALSLPLIDFLITSPPYWNMLKKTRGGVKSSQKQRIEKGLDEYYSDSLADLGNIDELSKYMETLTDYFLSFKPILKPGAYLMIILQNCRPKDGIMRPIAWDVASLMKKHFTLRQEFIWCQDQKFMGIWGYPTTYVSNVHHHYCLVFQKNDK